MDVAGSWLAAMRRVVQANEVRPVTPREATARLLRAARDHAGITIEELASRTGREAYYLSMAESAGMNVNQMFIVDILQACDLPPDWNPKT